MNPTQEEMQSLAWHLHKVFMGSHHVGGPGLPDIVDGVIAAGWRPVTTDQIHNTESTAVDNSYKDSKMIPASNTKDCFRDVLGLTVKGVLFDAMPFHRHDLKQGNKTLVFEDGTGLTISSNGSFWRERKVDVDQAIQAKAQELAALQRDTQEVLATAGWGKPVEGK